MHPLAVDEAVGDGITDLCVVVRAVPQAADDLDVVGGLREARIRACDGRDPAGDHDRVEAAGRSRGNDRGVLAADAWEAVGVLDRDEIEQAALDVGDLVDPVARRQQLDGGSVRFAGGAGV
jgi:hypothetical protein